MIIFMYQWINNMFISVGRCYVVVIYFVFIYYRLKVVFIVIDQFNCFFFLVIYIDVMVVVIVVLIVDNLFMFSIDFW